MPGHTHWSYLPQFFLCLAVHRIGTHPPPRVCSGLQWLRWHLFILEVDKDGIMGAPGPAQANQVLTRHCGVVVAFPGGGAVGSDEQARGPCVGPGTWGLLPGVEGHKVLG